MVDSITIHFRFAAAAALCAAAGCAWDGDNGRDARGAGDVDPALTSALEDPILTDPALTQQANATAVRPPDLPIQASYPLGPDPSDGAPAQADGGACAASLEHGPQWAERMPAEFPPYPGARVTEAAGASAGSCELRMIAFATADPYAKVLEWYRGTAERGGYSAQPQQSVGAHVLAGSKAGGGNFHLVVTPHAQGSDIALIVDQAG